MGSPGGHADLRVILSPSTDPSFYKAGRWTQMGIAPLPSWSASHGWVQVSFVRAYLLFTAFPPERTTDFSHPAKSTKPLEGPCWHFSITHESVQCSGPRSNPFDSRAPTVTARHSPSRGDGTPPPPRHIWFCTVVPLTGCQSDGVKPPRTPPISWKSSQPSNSRAISRHKA